MTDPSAPRKSNRPPPTSRRAGPPQEGLGGHGFVCLDKNHTFELPEVPGGSVCPNCTLTARVLLSNPFIHVFAYEYRGVTVEVEAYETHNGAKARLDRFCVEHRIPRDQDGEWDFSEEEEHLATIWSVPLLPGFLLR